MGVNTKEPGFFSLVSVPFISKQGIGAAAQLVRIAGKCESLAVSRLNINI